MIERDEDTSAPVDPTAVVGRRMAGWLLDVALVAIVVLVVLLLLGDSFERPGSDTSLDLRQVGSDAAVFFRSTVAVVHTWEWLVAAGAGALATLLLLIVLPGRRGWTPGLLAAELRLVGADGGRVGVRKALGRFAGWVIDILPGIPIVGLLAMRFGRHHQRVGDRLARTYVVDRAFVGHPPTEPAPVEADGQPTPVLADSALTGEDGLDDGSTSEEGTVQRRLRRRSRADSAAEPDEGADPAAAEATAAEPHDWAPDAEHVDGEKRPSTGDHSEADPVSVTASSADDPGPGHRAADPADRPGSAPEGVVADQPRWDRDEERYVMWHGASGQWVAFDDDEQSWKPL